MNQIADSGHIQLEISNDTTIMRSNQLISNGLPLPRDLAIMDVAELELYDMDDHLIDAQFLPLAWWPDGSIKWILISVIASIAAGETKTYQLKYRGHHSNSQVLLAKLAKQDSAGFVEVNTGSLKFFVNRNGRLLDQLQLRTENGWIDLNRDQEYLGPIVQDSNDVFYLGPVEHLSINNNGSTQIDITLSGSYRTETQLSSKLSYIIRIIAQRGGTSLQFFHTLRNHGAKVKLDNLVFQVPFKSKQVNVFHESQAIFTSEKIIQDQTIGVLQDDPDSFKAGISEEMLPTNGRFSGWINATNQEQIAISATTRHFWQTYPKSLDFSSDNLMIGLLPQTSENYDSFLPGDQRIDSYVMTQGESRTHEFLINFHDGNLGAEDIVKVIDNFHNPLLILAPWEWYTKSGTLGDLSCRDFKRFSTYEKSIDQSLELLLERRERLKLYGDRNFGDDSYRTLGAWNNCEYDYPHVGMLMFLRGCGRSWFDEWVLPAARHLINIDIINAGLEKGMVYQHDNCYSPDTLGHSAEGHGKLGSHAWIEGILAYYAFTGDFLACDVAMDVANRWADETNQQYQKIQEGLIPIEKMYGTERQWGWTNVSLMGAYNIFPQESFLQATTALMDVAQKLQQENGLLGGFFERKGFAGILMGSPIMDSMVMYYQATQKPEIKDFIVSLGRALGKYGWVDPPGAWAYHAQDQDYRTSSDRNLAPAVAYAYHYSDDQVQDQVLWTRAKTGFMRSWDDVAQDGKTVTQAHRFALRMLALMAIYE